MLNELVEALRANTEATKQQTEALLQLVGKKKSSAPGMDSEYARRLLRELMTVPDESLDRVVADEVELARFLRSLVVKEAGGVTPSSVQPPIKVAVADEAERNLAESKRDKEVSEANDRVTFQRLLEVSETAGVSASTASRLWKLLDSQEVKARLMASRLKLEFDADNAYSLSDLKKVARLQNLREVRGLGPNSGAYKLLRAVADLRA